MAGDCIDSRDLLARAAQLRGEAAVLLARADASGEACVKKAYVELANRWLTFAAQFESEAISAELAEERHQTAATREAHTGLDCRTAYFAERCGALSL